MLLIIIYKALLTNHAVTKSLSFNSWHYNFIKLMRQY